MQGCEFGRYSRKMSHAASEYVKHLRQAPNGAKLTPAEKAVLSQLADDHNQDKGCAWPSVGNIASRACMTERHCHRLLRGLEVNGVVELNPRLRENGGRSSSEYRFPQIDPPFDTKAVRLTAKTMELQRLVNAQRAVQQPLPLPPIAPPNPPDTDVRGGMTPMSGGDGHRCQGGYDTDVRGGMTSVSGGIDPLLEPLLDLLPEPALDPRTPPTPPSGGVNLDPDVQNGWARLHRELKSDLASGAGNDYDVCFRGWRLDDLRRMPNGWLLVTSAEDEAATQAGLDKYRKRLERLARKHLCAGQDVTVTIRLHRTAAVPEAPAKSAAAPDPWREVKGLVLEALERMPNRKHAAEGLENFRAAIEPAVLAGVEVDGTAPVWTLVSPNAKKTRAVMAMLRRQVGAAMQAVAGREVQILVRDAYRGA